MPLSLHKGKLLLKVETDTVPIDLYVQQKNENSIHRITGSPLYSSITASRTSTASRKKQKKSSLQILEEHYLERNNITGEALEEG